MKIKKLNESKTALTEETLEQAVKDAAQDTKTKKIIKAAQKIGDVEFAAWDGPYGNIEQALDDALESALDAADEGEISEDNVIIVGRAGTGKTERIKEWARQRGINLVPIRAAGIDPTDLEGIVSKDEEDPKYSTPLGNKLLYGLDEDMSVLFLDEVNRADPDAIGSLLTVVQNHLVYDPGNEGGNKYRRLKGMLFTVMAMNPEEGYQVTPLDMAMRTRGGTIKVEPDSEFQKLFFDKYFTPLIAKNKDNPRKFKKYSGQYKIAQTLMQSPMFRWDNTEEEEEANDEHVPTLNPRTLTAALKSCKGTKEDFLRKFSEKCNPNKLEMVEDILDDYIDVEDKANDALKYGDENPFASKQKSLWDQLGF